MRLAEIRETVQFKGFQLSRTTRQLDACYTVDDLRALARRRLPRVVFDYLDGGADEELTVADNQAAFRSWQFVPRVLQDVSSVDVTGSIFGRPYGAPLALCPTGYTRMMHPSGEAAVARAALAHEVPYVLSTAGTTSIEALSKCQHGDLWFQSFILRDRGLTHELVQRAEVAGYSALEITVDTPVAGRRNRDLRNGLTVPPSLRLRALVDIAQHLGYWSAMLRSPGLRFANLGAPDVGEERVSPTNLANLFDPSVTWDDIAELRSWWHGPMLVKGPLSPEECKQAVALGLDGVHLSNHGGRQLDRSLPALDLVRPAREALGEGAVVVLDSGVRHGADIAVALAHGADFCGVGRPYLYGLAAAGERGVAKVIDLLVDQLKRTMQLVGVVSLGELRLVGSSLLRRALVGSSGPTRRA